MYHVVYKIPDGRGYYENEDSAMECIRNSRAGFPIPDDGQFLVRHWKQNPDRRPVVKVFVMFSYAGCARLARFDFVYRSIAASFLWKFRRYRRSLASVFSVLPPLPSSVGGLYSMRWLCYRDCDLWIETPISRPFRSRVRRLSSGFSPFFG